VSTCLVKPVDLDLLFETVRRLVATTGQAAQAT